MGLRFLVWLKRAEVRCCSPLPPWIDLIAPREQPAICAKCGKEEFLIRWEAFWNARKDIGAVALSLFGCYARGRAVHPSVQDAARITLATGALNGSTTSRRVPVKVSGFELINTERPDFKGLLLRSLVLITRNRTDELQLPAGDKYHTFRAVFLRSNCVGVTHRGR